MENPLKSTKGKVKGTLSLYQLLIFDFFSITIGVYSNIFMSIIIYNKVGNSENIALQTVYYRNIPQ